MLPDFPELKRTLGNKLNEFVRIRAKNHPNSIIGEISSKRLCEGHTNSTSRSNFEDVRPMQHLEEVVEIKKKIEDITLEDELLLLDDIAKKMVEKQHQYLFETMSDVCNKSGNVVDAKGTGLNIDKFIEMLEKIEIAFDKQGKPKMPTLCLSPLQFENMTKIIKDAESNPAIKERLDNIMRNKKEKWDAREAARKLVG